jgi:hypothetical protein
MRTPPKKLVDYVIDPNQTYVVYSKRRDDLGIMVNHVVIFDQAAQLYQAEGKDVYILGTVQEYLMTLFRWAKLQAREDSEFLSATEYARLYNVPVEKIEKFCRTSLAIALGVHSIIYRERRRYFIPTDLKTEMFEWMLFPQRRGETDERKKRILLVLQDTWTPSWKVYRKLVPHDDPDEKRRLILTMMELKKSGKVVAEGRGRQARVKLAK